MSGGTVEHIHVARDTGEPMEARDSVDAVAERGLRGDRYYEGEGIWNLLDQDRGTHGASDLTLIEVEALEAVERDADVSLDPGVHRRNLTTRDVPLNHLVGRRFEVGSAVCEGIQLCEPCGYMQSLVDTEGLAPALVHRGGLNARIVTSGRINLGDEVRW